ncbi:hypothetical protein M4D52_29915 [Paenibacillus lactis]|uniref:hypothetical protein n=1 Tax=Paenibacillus lactis TaxID=228574 RepID=UPI002040AED8|nr:hypothetical protein [Paenibacillus lactis]MCM3497654.1 hypothetical protein [Paenibacillus lactis]
MLEKEIEALKALGPSARLFGQIQEWKRPGRHQFSTIFPEAHTQWIRTATIFERSKDPDFRTLGNHMRRIAELSAEMDEMAEDTRQFRRKLREYKRALERQQQVLRRLIERTVPEDGV